MTPPELQLLAELRRQRKAPKLAVFVTDDWKQAEKLTNDIGALAIRVRSASDFDHDWQPIAGLWVILWLRKATPAQWADFSSRLMTANPSQFSTFRDWHISHIHREAA